MIRAIGFVLASTMLAGAAVSAQAPAPSAPVSAATEGKPQYGTFGFDTAGMNKSVAAGDNFFDYANGTWAKNTPIPPDKARYGLFNVLDDLSKERTRWII